MPGRFAASARPLRGARARRASGPRAAAALLAAASLAVAAAPPSSMSGGEAAGEAAGDEGSRTASSRTTRLATVDLPGPDLVSWRVITARGTTAMVRLTFDEQVNATAVDASRIHLYGYDGRRFTARSVTVQRSRVHVDATFVREEFDRATAGGIDRFAVQDADGNPNVEQGFPLQSQRLARGETAQPDLLRVAARPDGWRFSFDQAVHDADDADLFHLVLSDGTILDGTDVRGQAGTSGRIVRFPSGDGAARVVAAYVDEEAVRAAPGDSRGNPRQVVTVADGANRPTLTGVTVDAAAGAVEFQFSEAVELDAERSLMDQACVPPVTVDVGGVNISSPSVCMNLGEPPLASYYRVYGVDGVEHTAVEVAEGDSPRSVVATFDDGVLNGLVQGATVGAGAVLARRDDTMTNLPGGRGFTSEFEAGQTAAPELTGVGRETLTDDDGEVEGVRFVLRFDQAATPTSASNVGPVAYTRGGRRIVVPGESCEASDDGRNVVQCTVETGDVDQSTFDALRSAVELTVPWGVLWLTGDDSLVTYETAARL